MTDQEILSVIADEVEWSGDTRDSRVDDSEEARRYFDGDLPAPPPESEVDQGMSTIVSRDVQDVVFAVQAEIMPAFTGVAPVEFQPLSEQDEEQADLETQATNHVAQNCGIYMALNRAIMDVLLDGDGVCKVFWESTTEASYERVTNLPLMQLPQKLAPRAPNETVQVTDGEINEFSGTASGGIRRHTPKSKPRICSVPLSEFLVSSDFEHADKVDDVRFLSHQRPVTRSDLIAMGFDRDVIEALGGETAFNPDRSRTDTRSGYDHRYMSPDPATEFVMCCESYVLLDVDRDGIAERRLIVTAGGSDGYDVLLHNEPWGEQPFAVGVGYLGLDDWEGTSLTDRMEMIQTTKTDLLRELVNATKRNVRQRLGIVENDADANDAAASQMGGLIRMRTPNGLVPVPDVEIPQAMFGTMEYLDQMRADRGGGAVDATASARALSQGGDWSLERMMSAAEQLNAYVAKNITETLVKTIFRKLHKLLRQYSSGQMMVPGSAGWRSTEPAQWSPREDMVVSLGMSVGERARRTAALQAIGNKQGELVQGGKEGTLVDDVAIYQGLIDMARMSGLPTPEQYFVDPRSQQAQQAAAQKQEAAIQAQQQELEREQEMQEFQYRLITDVERVKGQFDLQTQRMKEQSAELDRQLKAITTFMDQRIKMAEVEADIDQADAKQAIDRLQLINESNG